ncbi:MAG: amidohydrolase [Deltaproteobacteria bacterium]|nr:amidohydrolase [Deltaproteobacteria bacterium]MBW2382895.1 amidohydrolase [Deltaproteobacteria bacterium]MBW2696228.1 amidohydrolase [Deltaproteobacteria bacterium]
MPKRLRTKLLLAAVCLLASPASAQSTEAAKERQAFVDGWVERNVAGLVVLYKELHANPELSLEEEATAELVATELHRAGYEVTPAVGAFGVVGVLRNGAGPTVLIRADMDALPVTEATGLDYASRVVVTREDGKSVGVMHACGHDVHTTNLLATARLLALARDRWSGTLVLIAQPAEELGRGAKAMIGDGLFDRFPVPDYTLALHVESSLAAGEIGYRAGWAFANVDAVDVTIHGRGGHGARPHLASDPIVTASYFVTALQTLVSRRVDPKDSAVVSVGSFHAGNKHNVIPDEAHLQLTVRSYTDDVRKLLLDGITQIATDTCAIWDCPAPPDVTIREDYTPAVYNDPELTARAVRVFETAFGKQRVVERPPSMGGEDFGRYGRMLGVPSLIFRVGAQDPALLAASREPGGPKLPSLHSSRFAPKPEPTLRAAVRAMGLLALDLLQPPPEPEADEPAQVEADSLAALD